MSQVDINNKRIEKAFANSAKSIQNKLLNGMKTLLEWGMMECLKAHDEQHRNHFDMGDGYGWLLLKDGNPVAHRIYEGAYNITATNIESVRKALFEYEGKGQGYEGVVMASMKPRVYFVVRKEVEFMQTAISNLKALNFSSVFVSA